MRLPLLFLLLAIALAPAAHARCIGARLAPYPCSDRIGGIRFYWGTHQRHAVDSDNWPVTWASDDAQYSAWGDGYGTYRVPGETRTYSIGLSRFSDGPEPFRSQDIYHGAGQDCPTPASHGLCGKSYGLVALDSDHDGDDELYMWLSPGSGKRNLTRSRLYYSRDFGASWRKTPVIFPRREGLVTPAFIQFGQSYSAIADTGLDPDFVYFYAIEPSPGPARELAIQTPGRVYLLRVHRKQMGNRAAYEVFTGRPDTPWSSNLRWKYPVFHDPAGTGWNLSAIYLPDIRRYLLITEHQRSFRGNMGIFESENPWGPWKTVAYFTDWATQTGAPAGAGGHQTFYWNLSARWSGKSGPGDITLLYSGIGKPDDSLNIVRARLLLEQPSERHHAAHGAHGLRRP